MNSRANIMYFIEHFTDMATRENHMNYVRMIQRDILRIVDAVAPADGSGAANVKHVRRVLQGLQAKSILGQETVNEIDMGLKERETHAGHHLLDLEEPGLENGSGNGGRGVGDGEGSTAAGSGSVASKEQGSAGTGRYNGAIRVDKRQIEQRIEEDRERNKRLRESMWVVSGDDAGELSKFWDEVSDVGEDDYLGAEEEVIERNQMVVV
jgi:CTD kinase subunit gamma